MDDGSQQIDLTDESDRGCVLAGASLLEEAIEKRFRRVFAARHIAKHIQDSLFDSNGPLATFSGKIKLGYATGLFSKETFSDLETIRNLRNKTAHIAEDFDLLNDAIGQTVESLKCVKEDKGKLPRYSIPHDPGTGSISTEPKRTDRPSNKKVLSEARARLNGYIKFRKSLFALGIKSLQFEIETGLTLEEAKQITVVSKVQRGGDTD